MTNERIDWRPHLYEIVIVINFFIIFAMTMKNTHSVILTLPFTLIAGGGSMLIQGVAGIIVRLLIGLVRGNWRDYFDTIRKPAWIVESLRVLLGATLLLHVYSWIKISIPLLHPRLFDQQLWDIDRAIFFGISPNILFLNLFSNHYVLRAIDETYGNIFVAGLTVAIAYFLSEPSKRLRVAFITGHVFLWLIGGWLYMLIPSLGPAYRFPDIWMPYGDDFRTTLHLQAILWGNYSKVLRIAQPGSDSRPINILLGVAAFPSMHVAFQTFIFLWFRRIWKGGEVLFGIFVFVISLGAMVTGWHYLIDVLAGGLLAWIVWAMTSRRYKVVRWTELHAIV